MIAARYLMVAVFIALLGLLVVIAQPRADQFWCSWLWNPFEQRYVVTSTIGHRYVTQAMLRATNLTIEQWMNEWVTGRSNPPISCRRET